MRVENESVQKVTQTIGDPIETMKMLRDLKNNLWKIILLLLQ